MLESSLSLRPGSGDAECQAFLSAIGPESRSRPFSRHFNQNEEFFIRLDEELEISSFPVHHDVRQERPGEAYARMLRPLCQRLAQLLPQAFYGLSYFFDPSDIKHPGFYKIYRLEDELYLYLLRLDLGYRPGHHRPIKPGDNDLTPAYATKELFLESELVPVGDLVKEDARLSSITIKESVSHTWIGESGKGYMVRGIWMDSGLTKFFSKTFLPPGRSLYPFYPLFCKYKTVCCQEPSLVPGNRLQALPALRRALRFFAPRMEAILKALKDSEFSESLPEFIEARSRVPENWLDSWRGYRVSVSLNERDQKEYLLECTP